MNFNEFVYYDPSSPSGLRWKVNRYGAQDRIKVKSIGDVAGGHHKIRKYWYVKINGKSYLAHRVIFQLHNPDILLDDFVIDHVDGNRSNNNIENLRIANPSINSRNMAKRSDNTSGITGVGYRVDKRGNGKWVAFYQDFNKQKVKSFSINKYEYEKARALAIEFRENGIRLLNQMNSGYTERHGK